MFEHFDAGQIDTGGATIHVRTGGSGPGLLLLHGFPETHLMWRDIAPRLTSDFRVVDASPAPSTLPAMYGKDIQGVAYLILRDRSDAEDVLAETLLTAYERAADLRDERAFRTWLLRIATNHALGMRRGSARVVRLHVVPDIGGGDPMPASTDRVALLDGVADLPEQMRAAIVLRNYADLSGGQLIEAGLDARERLGSTPSQGLDGHRSIPSVPR